MSKTHERRLRALETTGRANRLGSRIFQQSLTDPAVYYEGGDHGKPYGMAEIDALSGEGWQCIVLCWESESDSGRAEIRLSWGDESQEPATVRDRAA